MPRTDHDAAPADADALPSGEGDASPSQDDGPSRADMERALRFAHLVDMQNELALDMRMTLVAEEGSSEPAMQLDLSMQMSTRMRQLAKDAKAFE